MPAGKLRLMNLRDATLMFMSESAAHPAVASIAQSAYDRQLAEDEIDYRVLTELINEASGKGVLRDLRRKHGAVAFDAIVGPILQEIGQKAPIRSTRRAPAPEDDPLTARAWPPR
jgi:hypothetical protein